MSPNIQRAQRIAQSAGLLALMSVFTVSAFAVSAVVLMHQFDPAHLGLWWGPHAFFFGTPDGAMQVRQADEDTLYLAALIVVPLCALVARELLAFARTGLVKSASVRLQTATTK